ncbi:WAT1-related protein At1g43650 isoform X2 [Populus alba]|uniref:WAT1-related protein At1g43650 isoform X2 n=1 Tax=Populus alba TaxID=43335 RepID=UPI00158E29F6|nr:WAT1-related protein At1g43650-like isoform X2 [Populus alba]
MKGLFGCLNAMENQKPYIAMLLVQSVYAGMALFSKAAIARGMNSFVFVVYRQAFASVSLVPFAFFLERKEAAPLSYGLLFKIFLVSFCGVTLSLNLYYIAINYTTATLAAATTNAIPAITFVMAALLRMESISIKHVHGIAKVLGSVIGFSGVLVIAFVKGPPIKFMNWNPANDHGQIQDSSKTCCSREEWIKGSLLMISANTLWSLWLVLQGIVVTGITYWLQIWTIEKKGPVFTSMFTPFALIITAIFSAFLWKETFNWGSVGGDVLLVSGLYGVLWGKKKEDGRKVTTNGQNTTETKEKITLECISYD